MAKHVDLFVILIYQMQIAHVIAHFQHSWKSLYTMPCAPIEDLEQPFEQLA